MIGSMRRNRKILSIVLWLVIIAFVSTIFVVWGIGTNEHLVTYAAKVGGENVSYEEYRNAYEQRLASVRQIFGNDFASEQGDSAEFAELVLNELINSRLMLKEADRMGIPATDFEVVNAIRSVPAFQKDGVFDPETYVQVLRANGQTPAFFEANLRNSIKIEKFQNLVKNAQYAVSREAALNEYNYRNTEATVEYFSVPVDFVKEHPVSADNVSAFYEKNKEKYRVPAKIKLKYIVFDKDKFADNVTVSEEQVGQYYANNLAQFTKPETITIKTVRVTAKNPSDQASLAEAKKKIDEAFAELKAGKKFAEVIAGYSDVESEHRDASFVRVREDFPESMAEELFALKKGDYSQVIRTEDGFLIIYIDNKTPAEVSPLKDVKAGVAEKIKEERLNGDFRKYVYDFYRDIVNLGNITAYTNKNPDSGLKVKETAVFTENESPLGVLDSQPGLKDKIFALGKGEISQMVTYGDSTYLFEAEEKTDSFIPLLDAVMAAVTSEYKREAAKEATLKNVEEALSKNGFDKAAALYKVPVKTTEPFIMNDSASDFAARGDLAAEIFKGKPGETLKKAYLIGDYVYGVKIKALTKPSEDKFEQSKDEIASYIRSVKEDAALNAYLDYLKTKTKVVISESFIQNVIEPKKAAK